MKKLYHWDQNSIIFKPVPITFYIKASIILITISLISFTYGLYTGVSNNKPHDCITENQQHTIGTLEWKDSVFNDYEKRAEIYLSQYNTPIEAGMLRLAAYNAYDSTGILLPVELALTQAHLESALGTKGRSPANNPYNVGENDSGTVKWFTSTFEGVQAYYYLMTKNYLKCKSVSTLLKSFTNCNGKRYASNPNYEHDIKILINKIKTYTDAEIKKQKEINTISIQKDTSKNIIANP